MKNVYLGHSTAQWYWLHAKNAAETLKTQPHRRTIASAATCERDIACALGDTLFSRAGIKLDLITSCTGRRSNEAIAFHYFNGALPARSFVQLTPTIFMASPELSFVQAARELSLPRLIHYGCALCGNYVLDEASPWGVLPRPAISTRRSLASFVEECDGLTGIKQARRALPFILEKSRSPRESSAGLLISLPYKHGGKALGHLELNRRIDIPQKLQNLTDRSFFVADFFWDGKTVAAEYDSDVAHSGDAPRMTDAIKRNVLPLMGFTPFSFTKMQVDIEEEMDKSCESLCMLLGAKTRQKLPGDYEQRKTKLRHELLACAKQSAFDGSVGLKLPEPAKGANP